MKGYRVTLHEEPGDKLTLVFDCRADDADHAAEQAGDAYPGCEIINVTEFEEDGMHPDEDNETGVTGGRVPDGVIKRNHSVTGDLGMLAGLVAMAGAATQNRPYSAPRGPKQDSGAKKKHAADRRAKTKQSKASKRRNRR